MLKHRKRRRARRWKRLDFLLSSYDHTTPRTTTICTQAGTFSSSFQGARGSASGQPCFIQRPPKTLRLLLPSSPSARRDTSFLHALGHNPTPATIQAHTQAPLHPGCDCLPLVARTCEVLRRSPTFTQRSPYCSAHDDTPHQLTPPSQHTLHTEYTGTCLLQVIRFVSASSCLTTFLLHHHG